MLSFMVIGMGRFGSSVATELCKIGHEVLIIDKKEELVAKVADFVTHALVGDAKDESVLRSAGAHNYDCVVVAIANDLSDSILITLMLKDMGVPKVVCKAQDERHAKALSLIGADVIVRPEFDMGKRLAHSLGKKNILDYIELSSKHSIVEVSVPKPWRNKSILENNVRNKYGLTILAIRSESSDEITISPDASYILKENDLVIVVGSNENLDAAGFAL